MIVSGQKVDFPPVSGQNGLQQLASSLNSNFSKVQQAFNQRNTTQVLYDTNHSTTRVLIGKVASGGNKFVIAVSREGEDVVKALAETPLDKKKFIFHSEIVNELLEEIGKELDVILKQAELMSETIGADIAAFEAIQSALGGIEGADTSAIYGRISALRSKKIQWDGLVQELRQADNKRTDKA